MLTDKSKDFDFSDFRNVTWSGRFSTCDLFRLPPEWVSVSCRLTIVFCMSSFEFPEMCPMEWSYTAIFLFYFIIFSQYAVHTVFLRKLCLQYCALAENHWSSIQLRIMLVVLLKLLSLQMIAWKNFRLLIIWFHLMSHQLGKDLLLLHSLWLFLKGSKWFKVVLSRFGRYSFIADKFVIVCFIPG